MPYSNNSDDNIESIFSSYIYQTPLKLAVQFNIVFIHSEDKVVLKNVMYTLKNVVGNISVCTLCLLEVDEIRKAYVFRTQVLASLILMRHLSYFLLNLQQTKKKLILTLTIVSWEKTANQTFYGQNFTIHAGKLCSTK